MAVRPRTARELAAALREMATTWDPPAMYYQELLEEAAEMLEGLSRDLARAGSR